MSTFTLRLPESLDAHARKLAAQDQASPNKFIAVAVISGKSPSAIQGE